MKNKQLKDKIKKTKLYSVVVSYRKAKIAIEKLLYPVTLIKAGVRKSIPSTLGITKEVKYGKEVIISLTSFPERIEYVDKTICSLLNQKVKANKVILWLSKEQFDNRNTLPSNLLSLESKGLSIEFVDGDIKSYKKLVPALIKYPNSIIVTADDDLYYPRNWLEELLVSYESNPLNIHCQFVTSVMICNNKFIFKDNYGKDSQGDSSYHYKILGGSGTLYPPGSLYSDAINEELFMSLAPTNDDIWFWAMALINRTKITWIKNHMKTLYYVEGSQEDTPCLVNDNNHGKNLREEQTKQVFERYDLINLISEVSNVTNG